MKREIKKYDPVQERKYNKMVEDVNVRKPISASVSLKNVRVIVRLEQVVKILYTDGWIVELEFTSTEATEYFFQVATESEDDLIAEDSLNYVNSYLSK